MDRIVWDSNNPFDLSEAIKDLNSDNELIRDLIFIRFMNKMREINTQTHKSLKYEYINNAYEDSVFYCNKVLNKKKASVNLNFEKNKSSSVFFANKLNSLIRDKKITIEILKSLKKKFQNCILDYKVLKKIRRNVNNINLADLNITPETYDNVINIFKDFLTDYKDYIFMNLLKDLQYEYCIFKAENTKLINYQDNLYPISLTKRISTEEKIKNHFTKIDDIRNISDLLRTNDLNESYDSQEYLINKVIILIYA